MIKLIFFLSFLFSFSFCGDYETWRQHDPFTTTCPSFGIWYQNAESSGGSSGFQTCSSSSSFGSFVKTYSACAGSNNAPEEYRYSIFEVDITSIEKNDCLWLENDSIDSAGICNANSVDCDYSGNDYYERNQDPYTIVLAKFQDPTGIGAPKHVVWNGEFESEFTSGVGKTCSTIVRNDEQGNTFDACLQQSLTMCTKPSELLVFSGTRDWYASDGDHCRSYCTCGNYEYAQRVKVKLNKDDTSLIGSTSIPTTENSDIVHLLPDLAFLDVDPNNCFDFNINNECPTLTSSCPLTYWYNPDSIEGSEYDIYEFQPTGLKSTVKGSVPCTPTLDADINWNIYKMNVNQGDQIYLSTDTTNRTGDPYMFAAGVHDGTGHFWGLNAVHNFLDDNKWCAGVGPEGYPFSIQAYGDGFCPAASFTICAPMCELFFGVASKRVHGDCMISAFPYEINIGVNGQWVEPELISIGTSLDNALSNIINLPTNYAYRVGGCNAYQSSLCTDTTQNTCGTSIQGAENGGLPSDVQIIECLDCEKESSEGNNDGEDASANAPQSVLF